MYKQKIFEITDKSVIEQFIKDNGFATLISKGMIYPSATHIPLELEVNVNGEKVLRGHLSKANPQWTEFKDSSDVLVVFLSPIHHYISSSWYNHPNAPTWNYMSVHVSGKIKIIEGNELWDSVRRLTNRYEKHYKNPVSLDTLPDNVLMQMNEIVGIEIAIDKMECSFKLSQNRNEEDFKNIIKELRVHNSYQADSMADLMEKLIVKNNRI